MGSKAVVEGVAVLRPSTAWLGRVVNALGQPIDGKGPLALGPDSYPLRNSPPPAHCRNGDAAPVRTARPKKDHRQAGREARQAERERAKLEKQVDDLQAAKVKLEAVLADPDLFARDPDMFAEKTDELTKLQHELNEAEERWLALELEAEAAAT